jgi:hypothetical protein
VHRKLGFLYPPEAENQTAYRKGKKVRQLPKSKHLMEYPLTPKFGFAQEFTSCHTKNSNSQ